jgi:ribosomal-protein-alanine N-acetyltransferase
MGVCMATLEVRDGNKKAQRLYEDFKFEIVAKRHSYYSDNNEDALIMTLNGLGKEYLMWLEKTQVL